MRFICIAFASLLLGACQVSNFEKAPIAEAPCDTRLVGHWNSVGDQPGEEGDVQLDVSPTCLLEVSDLKDAAMRQGDATQLHVGEFGAQRYVWVDSIWAQQRFDSELATHVGDIHLMRYQLIKDELVLNSPDDKSIAHRIIDDSISGETVKDDKGLLNRITGGPHPDLLESKDFFDVEALRFRRGAAVAKP